MNYKRAEHQSLRNRDGSIFIFGGYDDKQEPLSIVELFDPLSLNFKLSEKNISTYFETIVIKNRFEHTETIKSDGTMVVIGGMDEKDVLTPEIEELRLSTSKDEFMEILVISGTPPYKFNLLKGNGLVDKKGSYTPLGVFSSQQVLLEVRDSANKSNIVSFYVNILEQ